MKAAGDNNESRIAWGLRSVTTQAPRTADIARLMKLQSDATAAYAADPALLKKAGTDAETAALTLVASTILNFDEALTK